MSAKMPTLAAALAALVLLPACGEEGALPSDLGLPTPDSAAPDLPPAPDLSPADQGLPDAAPCPAYKVALPPHVWKDIDVATRDSAYLEALASE